ncbi:MAG: ABC transporter substrate-binding protein [Alphaproteobacteria bacterium]|nr:ABC transporter substrate-binding protein [Alphaproteobacteria bacterium]
MLSYRTGAYAPNGTPYANAVVDYYNMVNERDGGINGVKITFEECETGYATDRGVECYERLKAKGPTGASYVNPLSTGITFALTEKAPGDKMPIITMGYGRSESAVGSVFTWNFPILGTYWTAADIALQHVAAKSGGRDKLKGKKIYLVYHDSPYGKEPIPVLEAYAKRDGFEYKSLPVAHPGVEQKSQWVQIRREKPDWILLWGWGVMNSTSIKEAAAVNYPRDKMIGVWWSGAEPDVIPAGDGAKGYNALTLQHGAGLFPVHGDIVKHVYDKGKGMAKKEEISHVLYNRGLVNAMLGIEATRVAQKKYGIKPLTSEQIRWGYENLDITEQRIRELGMDGMIQPIKITCNDHEGVRRARVHQWDGKNWQFTSGWYEADTKFLRPMMEEAAKKYAAEKKITPRDCSKES